MKENQHLDQAIDVTKKLDYIHNGEPLAGYISENDVGPLNRTAKQLQSFIIFLKDELEELKQKIKEPETTEEVNTETPDKINELTDRIDHIQKVVAERLTEQDKRLQRIDNDINQYLRAKPSNFLDYGTVQNLEKLVQSLERKIQELEKMKVKEVLSENPNGLTEEQLAPYISSVNQLESKVRQIEIDIGQYDRESNQGSGIKNQVYQLLLITNRTTELLNQYQTTLSQAQENKIDELLTARISPLKIKSEQSFSISKEINERMTAHEKKINQFEQKFDIVDLLENQSLQSFLVDVQTNAAEAKTNAKSAKDEQERTSTELTSTTEKANTNQEEIAKLKALIGQSELITNQIFQTLETVVGTIGSPTVENSIVGQLTQIQTLKQEFSENIQNINMIIGQNVPGAETGFYRLLNEAKLSKVQYYKFRIPETAKKYKRLAITLPDYIANKGSSFIVRTYQDHKNFIVSYDQVTKKLYLDLGQLQSATDIIILPIKVEESGISEQNVEYIEAREETQ